MNTLRLCLTAFARVNSMNCGGCRHIKRWVAPTYKEITRRKKNLGPQSIPKRSNFIEWNREAEIFAFNKRLKEKFDIEKLNQAFINESYILQQQKEQEKMGIDEPQLDVKDNNKKFIETGKKITSHTITTYLTSALQELPSSGVMALHDYLMSEKILANAALHLGTKDIILTAEHPVSETTLAQTFLALVGALAESVNTEHAGNFVKDFLIAGLADKDLTEIWNPPQPFDTLCDFIRKETKGIVEARIIGKAGTNTMLSAYHIGLFVNQQFLGSGFGESIEEAKNVAASNVLHNMYGTTESSQPLRFDKS